MYLWNAAGITALESVHVTHTFSTRKLVNTIKNKTSHIYS